MISKKVASLLLILSLFFLASTTQVEAKRLLPFLNTASKPSTTAAATRGVTVSVKFRGDRQAIVASFSNINTFTSVAYSLSYTTNGIPQGVAGTILPGSNTAVREIIFGTCSNGICRYDRNITNARFVVITTLKNGTKISKTFILRV